MIAVAMGRSSESLEDKVADIRSRFAPLVGARVYEYQTAEIFCEGEWSEWPDLPIRLLFADGRMISISWSHFNKLWLASDSTLPFSIEGSEVKWVSNSDKQISRAIGSTILSVQLGRGQLSIEGHDIEVWTRLLIQLDTGWLEIFNALDENGYTFHLQHPAGAFVSCL